MNRLLMFHIHERSSNEVRMAPSACYMDADYVPVSVRLYAEDAPLRDAKFDIFVDGESIFVNNASVHLNATTGVRTEQAEDTTIKLPAGQNREEDAEDFRSDLILPRDSEVYCNIVDGGGGKNFSVQFELHQVSEDEESED